MTGILPNRQKKQRRRFRRCDAKRNTPVSRLSAPCCDFVGEVEEVSLLAGLRGICGPCEGRPLPIEKQRFPVRIQGRKSSRRKGRCRMSAPAPAHCVRQSRPLQGIPPLLKEMAFRCRIWSNRFLDRCFNSRKAQKFQRMMRCFGRFL